MPWHPIDIAEPPPQMTRVTVEDISIVLIRVGDAWHAIEDRCSHAGCAFSSDGEVDGHVLICNCHGSEFDIATGDALGPPAREPLRTFPVRASGPTVEVEI